LAKRKTKKKKLKKKPKKKTVKKTRKKLIVRKKTPKRMKGRKPRPRRVKKAKLKLRKKKKPFRKPSPKSKNKLKKKTIMVKRDVKVTKKKKAKKKKQIIVFTEEEMARVSDILSRPVVRQFLVDVGGENAIAIVKNFNTGMSDEEISKSLNLKISDVRAALNRLHSQGIVAYNREKDSETGWYSYSWYLNMEKIEKWAWESVRKYENPEENGGEYYVCPSCGNSTVVSFETALDRGFRCEICNHALEYLDEKRKEELGMIQMRKRL
jgi:transcription initiation factor TFIIE subunit alpha